MPPATRVTPVVVAPVGAPPTTVAPRRVLKVGSDRLAVGALVALALILRAPNLGRAYWVDEGISIGIASHRLADLPALLRLDGSPPLFYVVLHFWIRLFGTSETSTHALPLLVSLAVIPAGYWAGREMFGRRAGMGAAALFATNPFLGWYSSETRMYPIVVLISVVGPTLAWRALRDGTPADAGGAVAAFTALLYTHDWGMYLVAATAGVLAAVAWRANDRRGLMGVLAGGAAVLVLWSPWLSSFLFQAGHTAAPWAVRPAVGDFFADPATVVGGTLGFVVAPLLVSGGLVLRGLVPADRLLSVRVLAAVAAATMTLGFAGAQIDPSWTVRYLAVIVGPYLLAAAGVLGASRPGARVLIATCSALTMWSLVGLLLPNPAGRYAKSNVAALAEAAGPRMRTGDLVVLTQTEQTAVAYRYLGGSFRYVDPTGPVADPGVVDWRDIVARLQASDPCRDVAPSVDGLPVGAAVLVVNPDRVLGASGSAWSRAVNGAVRDDDALLARDRALSPVAIFVPAVTPRPFSPVDATLYRKTSTARACA